MKLATWNINSLRVRLPHVLNWLAANQPDVLCLQETKLVDENFPLAEIGAAGYQVVYCGQSAYNGVAILSKAAISDVVCAIPDHVDEQKRVVAGTIDGVRVIGAYIPNGQTVDSPKYQYKLQWLGALNAWLKNELARHPRLALLGDYNLAPEDRDVCDPVLWEGNVQVSPAERRAFFDLIALGLTDSFRLFEQPEKSYTWWDYRMLAFRRNQGLRIDHILLSAELAARCRSCVIDKSPRKLERPSDHAPVTVDIGELSV